MREVFMVKCFRGNGLVEKIRFVECINFYPVYSVLAWSIIITAVEEKNLLRHAFSKVR